MKRRPIKVYHSHDHADKAWLERLTSYLEAFKQQGHMTAWDNSVIPPGTEISALIDYQRSTSDLILLLLSDHYFASEFCSNREMLSALELHKKGKARTIPILLLGRSTPCPAIAYR